MTEVPGNGLAVRVLDANGATVGVAALVSPRHIVTNAHVVNTALGRDSRAQDQPSDEITVDFAGTDVPPLRARVELWLPPPRTGATGDDIAGLVLTSAKPPPGASPVRLAANLPARGQVVDVFGYPGTPPRPDGAWVSATVRGQLPGGRHLQLDSAAESSLRVQPGFSGGPVYDRVTNRVVGLISAAPAAASGDRDSYAITADRLRLAWPEVLDPRYARTRARATSGVSELTILHVSDPQFGRQHIFGGNGLTPADQAHDTVFQQLHDDLESLAENPGLRPDLMVVTGDLAEWGLRSEFDQVVEFLVALTEAVALPRRHVALVPGNHDINRSACEAYFLRQKADEREPVAPYWPKWEHFAAAFERFYEGVDGVSFSPDEPWTLFEMPDLAVVVAGLNSTMVESHRDEDHYGWIGEHQLRWFADRLIRYREQGWLRLGAVHHNAVRKAIADDENLKDADDLDRFLGQPGLVNLLLHGHTHDGRLQRLSSGLLVLSTGSAAVTADARPREIPNQYQLLTVDPCGVTQHARQYALSAAGSGTTGSASTARTGANTSPTSSSTSTEPSPAERQTATGSRTPTASPIHEATPRRRKTASSTGYWRRPEPATPTLR
jgi:3',5'-cyclic AMP phosphodiesterase CpdA/V8-like Glu-specific endopeptidase